MVNWAPGLVMYLMPIVMAPSSTLRMPCDFKGSMKPPPISGSASRSLAIPFTIRLTSAVSVSGATRNSSRISAQSRV